MNSWIKSIFFSLLATSQLGFSVPKRVNPTPAAEGPVSFWKKKGETGKNNLNYPYPKTNMNLPDQTLQTLIEGNQRYVEGRPIHPNRGKERRESLQQEQNPMALILGCSDSRVAPEIIFDQGVGDLFVVRVAGNVAGILEKESLDFGALALKAPLILVLGHENCGAVDATLRGQASVIASIATLIEPAVKEARKETGNLLENAIKMNVKYVVTNLSQTPSLAPLIKEGKIKIVGGYFHLDTGKVEIL